MTTALALEPTFARSELVEYQFSDAAWNAWGRMRKTTDHLLRGTMDHQGAENGHVADYHYLDRRHRRLEEVHHHHHVAVGHAQADVVLTTLQSPMYWFGGADGRDRPRS